jgi:hypothetical protein
MNKFVNLKKHWITITIICLAIASIIAIYPLILSTTTDEYNGIPIADAKEIPDVFDDVNPNSLYNDIVPSTIELDTVLPMAPDKLIIYKVIPVDYDYAKDIALKLGFSSLYELTEESDSNSENGQAYNAVEGDSILTVSYNGYFSAQYEDLPFDATDASVLSEEECIDIAQEWLYTKGLYPESVTRITTGTMLQVSTFNIETGYQSENTVLTYGVSFFTKIGDYEASLPTVFVEIDTDGTIIGVDLHAQQLEEIGYVTIIDAEKALDILTGVLTNEVENSPKISGCLINRGDFNDLVINEVSIQYTKSGNYIQPTYYFCGTAYYDDGLGTVKEFKASIDAVVR